MEGFPVKKRYCTFLILMTLLGCNKETGNTDVYEKPIDTVVITDVNDTSFVVEQPSDVNNKSVHDTIPDVVGLSNAWKQYCNSEYYIADVQLTYATENYITSYIYADDFYVFVESIDGDTFVTVYNLDNEIIVVYH